ncbi:MAG: nucleotide exchange factor GrpE [Candidatus Caldarchaeum sp.]|uniref:Nucleotide exchange factor GrpE n=3 Tax=Caldiarchaeum subterraneum TaxID=311458 RepID=A0A7C4E0C9_CALS0
MGLRILDGMSEEGAESLEELKAQNKELLERLSYAMAEMANLRRVMEKEVSRAEQAAAERLLRKLITVYEDLERVVKSLETTDAPPTLAQALQMVYRELTNILASEGVEKMDVIGKEFNPFDHEAVEYIESDTVTVDTVAEVLSNGYRMGDKILKPPRVKVARPMKQSSG